MDVDPIMARAYGEAVMAQLRMSMASAEITPSIGTPLGGYLGRPRFEAVGIHDPLHAKALALEGDGVPLLLFSLDLLGLTRDRADRLAGSVSRACGLSADRLVITCTHTHSGPSTLPLRGVPMADEGYFDYLQAQVASAGLAAVSRRRPATRIPGVWPRCGDLTPWPSRGVRRCVSHWTAGRPS